MKGFLHGYRVLDLTDVKGHLCGRILGDMGADVIKIEPVGGDPARNIGPYYHDDPDPEKSLNWYFSNANKRGVTLNLKLVEGRDLFKKLVAKTDLVLESFEPNKLETLGIGYDLLCKIKSDIVLTSITPFGQRGPYANYKVTDIVSAAMGGLATMFGDEDRAPVRITAPQACFLGGQHGAVGALSALYHREITGEGQWVDVSMHEAIVYTLTYCLPPWEHLGINRKRCGADGTHPRPEPLGDLRQRLIFPCLDGYVSLSFQGTLGAARKSSRALVAWANEEGYAQKIKDYNWETWDSATIEQKEQDFLEENITLFLTTKTKKELLEEAAKKRILMAPVNSVADLSQNPQIWYKGRWNKVFHPELNDTLTYPGPFVKVDQCPQRIYRRAPTIGEHNREIFGDILGMSTDQLNLLKAQEVI